MEDIKYNLGIDMGTDSIGWCLTDQNYKIIKKNGKSLWGVRLFKPAEDCSARRLFRGGRRRLARRKERLSLLRDLFTQEISYIDKLFFMRLDYSKYYLEDRPNEIKTDKDYLFPNEKFDNNQTYFKKYPTIYHLRKDLITSNNKKDIRLIYLAFQHMIKYRGNFLSEGVDFKAKNNDTIKVAFESINSLISSMNSDDNVVCLFDVDNFPQKLLGWYKQSKSLIFLKRVFKEEEQSDTYLKTIYNLIIGCKIKIKDIANNDDIEIDESICLSDADFETKYQEASAYISTDCSNIIKEAKIIYDQLVLKDMLGDSQYISDVMVNRYNEHKKQLKEFKSYVKNFFDISKYNLIFRVYDPDNKAKINNYSMYIGSSLNSKAEYKRSAHCTRDEFYLFIKKQLDLENKSKNGDEYAKRILSLMDEKKFLLRQNSSENGILPYQLNEVEMNEIFNKQSHYYPFFNNVDEDGLTVKDKIISLLKYRIPYYVGPLDPASSDEEHHKFSWSIRNKGYEHTKIVPWNFDKVINREASAEAFIHRMQNKCVYLHDYYCMPKGSLLYGYYTVLQDLNNLTFNGGKIDEKSKTKLLINLYLKKNKVTLNDIQKVLGKDVVISLKNGSLDKFTLNGSLKSVNIFTNIFGSLDIVKKYSIDIERLIVDLTLFEDKSIIVKRLTNNDIYSKDFINLILSNKKYIQSIKGLRFEKYCSFSKELLELKGITIDKNGEVSETEQNVLEVMETEGRNLEEIVNLQPYKSAIESLNADDNVLDFSNELSIKNYIDDLYVSPGMKRPLLQSIKIVNELEHIIKHPIDNFYIETTRTNKDKNKGKKQESRKEKLLELLKHDAKQIVADIQTANDKSFISELESESDGNLQSKKIFLYYLQCGKDVYSGDAIDLNRLDNYDIDHIIPQARIKDDSLQNTVLVRKDLNNLKQDSYPIPNSIISNNGREVIEFLHKNKTLMSDSKYEHLVRNTNNPLSEEELQGFANRQLAFTNQAVKALCDMLKSKENKPKVVYCKAENVTDFRKDFDITKSRLANNFHHAHDAFLNIIVGDVYDKFYIEQFIKHKFYKYQSANLGKYLTPFTLEDIEKGKKEPRLEDSNGKVIWQTSLFIPYIYKVIKTQFDIMVTEPTYFKKSGFYKQKLVAKGKNLISSKTSDPILSNTEKYGGYQKPEYGFYDIKKDKDGVIRLIPTPVYLGETPSETSIKLNTILKRNKSSCRIAGVTNNSFVISKGFEAHFSFEIIRIIKKIDSFIKILTENKLASISKSCKVVGSTENIEFLEKAKSIPGFSINEDFVVLNNSHNYFSRVTRDEIKTLLDYLLEFVQKNRLTYELFSNCINVFSKENFDLILIKPIYISIFLSYQLVLLLQRSRLTGDFSLIGLGPTIGSSCISNGLKFGDELYSESITGFYKKLIYEVK